MTVQELNEFRAAFKAFRDTVDERDRALKTATGKVADLELKLERINADLEGFEAKLNRRGGFAGEPQTGSGRFFSEKTRLMFDSLRGKSIPFETLQSKGLTLGNDVGGGYLAPLEYVQDMISNVVEFSPIRSIARVRQTSRPGITMPKRTGSAAATWVSETGSRTETQNPAFGMAEIRPHELHAMTKVSRAELEDSAYPIEEFLRSEFAEQFGVAEGTAFVGGNGVGTPEGFLVNSSIASVNSGNASQITADGLIALYYELKEQYANNAYWVLSRSTLKTIRQLKDGQGNYLWAAGIKDAARPATILDRPYVVCPDMPSISANTFPVAFGDFRRGYLILDRVELEIMVDPYSSKSTGFVEITGRRRVGGQVILPEAIKLLKIAA